MFNVTDELDIVTAIAIVIPLVLLFIASFIDLYRRQDLSVVKKVLWAALIVVTVYVGVAVYFATRPPRKPEGKKGGMSQTAASRTVDRLDALGTQHAAGEIDEVTYLEGKRMLLGLPSAGRV